MNDCVVSWFCLASQTSYNLRVRAGRTHLAKLIWPSRGEQRAAKFIHKGARDLSPYDVGEDFEPLRVISRISRILPNPRAEALRDVHDTFHVSLHERKYGVIQNGKWVVPLVETRRGVEGLVRNATAVYGTWGVCTMSETRRSSRIGNGVCGGNTECGTWSAPGKMVYGTVGWVNTTKDSITE